MLENILCRNSGHVRSFQFVAEDSRKRQKASTCCYPNSRDSQFSGERWNSALKVSSSKQCATLSEGTHSVSHTQAKGTWKTTGLACCSGKTCFPAQPAAAFPWFLKDDVITSKVA